MTTTTLTPCMTNDPDLWFSNSAADIAEAKRLCGSCPLSAFNLCREQGKSEEFGVWAGEDEIDRDAASITRERRAQDRAAEAVERAERDASIVRLRETGLSVREVASTLGVSKGTVQRALEAVAA